MPTDLPGGVLGAYTLLAAAVVVALTALLAVVRMKSAFEPIRTWLVMLPIIFGALWLGLPAWTLVITLVSLFGFREFARATGLAGERGLILIASVAIVVENLAAYLGRYDVFMATPMWAIFLLALVPIIRNRTDQVLRWFSLAVLGILFYGFFLAHLTYLANSPLGLGYVLFVTLMTQLNDALGYIYGKTLGRHRWTVISPNKRSRARSSPPSRRWSSPSSSGGSPSRTCPSWASSRRGSPSASGARSAT